MTDSTPDDRLIEQLGAMLREPDEEFERALQQPIDPALEGRLLELMESNRVSEPTPLRAAASRRRWMVVTTGLAAAAAVLAFVWIKMFDSSQAPQLALASISDYDLDPGIGISEKRSGDPAPRGELRYRQDTPFTWTMQPKYDVAAPVDVRACARSERGDEIPLDVDELKTIAPSGWTQLHGLAGALGLSPGVWDIWLAVGYTDALAEVGSICQAESSDQFAVAKLPTVELMN